MQAHAHYVYELSEVQRALLQLDQAVERSLVQAMQAFLHNDRTAARFATFDDEIDERRSSIEARVLRLIASQQPLASDLRFLLAALRIAEELERIGDYIEGIAVLAARDLDEPPLPPPPELHQLSEQTQSMLHASVEAFLTRDASAVARLERADNRVDALTAKLQASIIHDLKSSPRSIAGALQLLFVAHNLERIADRAVNIAERTAFIVTGKLPGDG